MLLPEILFSLVFAVLFTSLLYFGFSRGDDVMGLGLFFLLLFPAIWAVSAWAEPVGPVIYGFHWVPGVFIGFWLILLMAAFIPPRRPEDEIAAAEMSTTT